jgi:hypothetical protein
MSFSLPFAEELRPPDIWVVSSGPEPWRRTREAVGGWSLNASVHWRPDVLPPSGKRWASGAPHVLVVDGDLGEQPVGALVQAVAQQQPEVEVFTFVAHASNPPYMVWPWASAQLVLAQWLERYVSRSDLDLGATWFA